MSLDDLERGRQGQVAAGEGAERPGPGRGARPAHGSGRGGGAAGGAARGHRAEGIPGADVPGDRRGPGGSRVDGQDAAVPGPRADAGATCCAGAWVHRAASPVPAMHLRGTDPLGRRHRLHRSQRRADGGPLRRGGRGGPAPRGKHAYVCASCREELPPAAPCVPTSSAGRCLKLAGGFASVVARPS